MANPERPFALRLHQVSVERQGVSIVHLVDAVIPQGSATYLVGPNGAGKSTLVAAILGLLPFSGQIEQAPRADGQAMVIGHVPQRFAFDRNLPVTTAEFLLASRQRLPLWCGQSKHLVKKIQAELAEVGIQTLADRPLGALSGGELQRVLLARALGQNPDLIILDEPGAGVDPVGDLLLCGLIERLQAERGFTVLMITHDLSVVRAHASHVLALNRSIVAQGRVQEVLVPAVLGRLFGLHAQDPSLDGSLVRPICHICSDACGDQHPLVPPSRVNHPPGCRCQAHVKGNQDV